MTKSFWFRRDKGVFNIGYHPQWDMKTMSPIHFYTNGWRPGDNCLSITLRIWRLDLNLTLFYLSTRHVADSYMLED